MKKFISGVIVGVLLFAGTTVFADSAMNLLGKKVQGTYEVTFNGKKISDAAVIEGSTYLPVRSVSDAAGINIAVEGKKINLTTDGGVQIVPDVSDAEIDKVNAEKGEISAKINILKNTIETNKRNLELEKTNTLPRLEKHLAEMKSEEYSSALGPELSKQGIENLEGQIVDSKKIISDLEAKVKAAEDEIKQLEAQLKE